MDAAVTNAAGSVMIMLGTGTGTFGAPTNFTCGSNPYHVQTGDFNGDGKADIAVACESGVCSILLGNGNGNGTFQPAANISVPSTPRGCAIGDFNGDGNIDLAVGRAGTNAVGVFLQNPGIPAPTITTQPNPVAVLTGQSAVFTVAATSPSGTPTFQWRRNGTNLVNADAIVGATSASLTINPAALSDNGSAIDCIVSNGCGSVQSRPAGLSVTWACPADFNHSDLISVQDIFDFLAAYFAGCP